MLQWYENGLPLSVVPFGHILPRFSVALVHLMFMYYIHTQGRKEFELLKAKSTTVMIAFIGLIV